MRTNNVVDKEQMEEREEHYIQLVGQRIWANMGAFILIKDKYPEKASSLWFLYSAYLEEWIKQETKFGEHIKGEFRAKISPNWMQKIVKMNSRTIRELNKILVQLGLIKIVQVNRKSGGTITCITVIMDNSYLMKVYEKAVGLESPSAVGLESPSAVGLESPRVSKASNIYKEYQKPYTNVGSDEPTLSLSLEKPSKLKTDISSNPALAEVSSKSRLNGNGSSKPQNGSCAVVQKKTPRCSNETTDVDSLPLLEGIQPKPANGSPKKEYPLNDPVYIRSLHILPKNLRESETFLVSWRKWFQFRKDIKFPITKVTMQDQVDIFANNRYSVEESCQVIHNSLNPGWRGLFPLERDYPIRTKKEEPISEKQERPIAMSKAPAEYSTPESMQKEAVERQDFIQLIHLVLFPDEFNKAIELYGQNLPDSVKEKAIREYGIPPVVQKPIRVRPRIPQNELPRGRVSTRRF